MTQKGSINTIEGFFDKAIEGLDALQDERRRVDPMQALKIGQFIMKLREYKDGDVLPFTFELIDPSGNSFVQNPFVPKEDPFLEIEHFDRSLNDYKTMGYNVEEAAAQIKEDNKDKEEVKEIHYKPIIQQAIESNTKDG